ncbi:MAG: sodium/glutamate symporter [Helicobacter sp.]|nr:sodium/glutamate symporter [Helicobacter sp.]
MVYSLNFYVTLVCMVGVLFLGRGIIKKVKFLQDYNIPEPVVGGIIVAMIIFCLNFYYEVKLEFNDSLKDPLMLAFFTSIGLSADFASFKKGGKILIIFLFIVTGLLFLQNILGILVAKLLGVNPLLGLLGGSITMSGGHGTGAAWADTFKAPPYSFAPAAEVAVACATFGLVMGGLIGGPVARYLVKKHQLELPKDDNATPLVFEEPKKERLITASSFVESLGLIAFCLLVGTEISALLQGVKFVNTLPTFVWCLFMGVILRNIFHISGIFKIFDREVSVIGNVSLSLFLAYVLMTINLQQLVSLALPIAAILMVQVITMILYAVFITFRFCGRDYDAAVLSAGHCGFGLGATPTAMVNMQTVTQHYGHSHMAFIVVPLVGAFFIDIVNAFAISSALNLFFG